MDYRIFGCPVYVLNKDLQDNPSSAKKWAKRAWQGIYLGHSKQHTHNVALIYNIKTSHVTPQFHLVFNEEFTTITPSNVNDQDGQLDKLFQK
jgi:hypothetical protein